MTILAAFKPEVEAFLRHQHRGGFYTALCELLERSASKEKLKILRERNWAVIRMLNGSKRCKRMMSAQ